MGSGHDNSYCAMISSPKPAHKLIYALWAEQECAQTKYAIYRVFLA